MNGVVSFCFLHHVDQASVMLGPCTQSWTSVEELQAILQRLGLDLDLMQLEGGSFAGRLLLLEVPPLRLVRLQLNRRVHGLGPKPKGVLTISLDLDPQPREVPYRSHGQALPDDSLFGLDPSWEVHLTLPTTVTMGMVFFPFEALARWAEPLGWPGFLGELQPGTNVVPMHPTSSVGLRAYLRSLFALAEQDPVHLQQPSTQSLIQGDLLPLLLEALVSGSTVPQRCRPPARIAMVKEVQQWMHDHPSRPVTLTDLCRQAHASRRTLIQGFQDHLGMGPMAYLKLLRLHAIHGRLLEADPRETHIGTLAGEWGFYNAGHFAADYRRLFGERPRDTLRRLR